MKRILLSTTATIAGLVALLGYKTHGAIKTTGALPTAGISAGDSSAAPTTGAPSPATTSHAPSSPAAASSTIVGSAVDTRYGIVQVKVTVTGRTIVNVGFVQLTAFDGRSARINDAAAPILLQQTLKAQSANIDGVSGASYTSAGYEQSLQSALDRAGV